jgi:regulator of RNase E activity RraA
MPDVPVLSPETLARLGAFPTEALVDALWAARCPPTVLQGVRPLFPGRPLAGRAVTLRFVPHRPDVAADKPGGEASPEYVAFERCGPHDVLVASSVGPGESVGGDIKFLRLAQRRAAGLVTDGSVRDAASLREYGLPVYCQGVTARQGPPVHWPWGVDEVIACGGVAVRPGDAVIGDDDGVVVVPAALAEEVLRVAAERAVVERVVKAELARRPGSPGRYYPFTDATRALVEEYRRRGEA